MTRRALTLFFAPLICFACVLTCAQSPTNQQKPVSPDTDVMTDSFLTQTVFLRVLAIDEKGHYLSDLKASDISVIDDGKPQTVEFFAKDDSPLRYALVVDNSGSMKPFLPTLAKIGDSLVAANKPGDDVALIRFVGSDQIKVLVDFTGSKQELAAGLGSMHTEYGQTAVVDGLYLAIQKVAERKAGEVDHHHLAVVLVSDGEDRSSYYKSSQLQELLRRSFVPVFVIGLVNQLDKEGGFIRTSPRQKAMAFLEMVAKESGGRVFYPRKSGELVDAVNEIAADMRAQYLVGYRPTNIVPDGKFHKVEVKFTDATGDAKRKIIARPGYFARGVEPQEETDQKSKKEKKKDGGKN